jgi:hypothetical protein
MCVFVTSSSKVSYRPCRSSDVYGFLPRGPFESLGDHAGFVMALEEGLLLFFGIPHGLMGQIAQALFHLT